MDISRAIYPTAPIIAALTLLAADVSTAETRIEEITVTARKVEESLQQVPVAVTALSGEELLRKNAMDIGKLEGMAPNVSFGRHGNFPNSAQISIRGMTSMDIERSFDPSVGVSIDGVFTATNANQMMDMFDVEQVEILRGPQGTLFGRNTLGGTVNVTRKQASTEALAGGVVITSGSYGRLDGKAAINIPLGSQLAARLSVFSSHSDGWVDNRYRQGPDHFMGEETLAARLNLVWDASVRLRFKLNYDYLKDRSDTGYVVNITTNDGYLSGTDVNGDDIYTPYLFCVLGNLCEGKSGDLYEANADDKNIANIDRDSVSLEANYDISDNLTLTYVGNYADHYEDIWLDWDGVGNAIIGYDGSTPVYGTFFHTDARIQNEQTQSHELRVAGEITPQLDIVAGLYWYQMEYDIRQNDTYLGLPIDYNAGQNSKSKAAFAEGNFALNDQFSLTLGLRYTQDDKTFSREMILLGSTIFDVNNLNHDWSESTFRLGADYQLSDDIMLYASYATGYKAGGFNGRAGSEAVALVPYNPETVNTFELGVKSEWFSQRLRLNAALFSSAYDDLQVDVNVPAPQGQNLLITNAASATSNGLEIELLALLTDATRLSINYGYLKAEYDDFTGNLFGETDSNGNLINSDFSGNVLRRAPEHQLALSLTQDWQLPGGVITGELSYNWKDSQHTTIDNDPYLAIEDYAIVDASLTWLADEMWRVSVFVHNATDEEQLGYQFRASGLWQFASPATQPRMAGITANYQF
ncbi:TonB-dependent receptor [Halioxenophilus aromaticivorans]|uniref:TonB-dependent receptor n=1 Tax=Halioxenophilus aromaticivorans TaxID=1306992 RepID=A0AAV3U4D7_9ALTE